MRSVQLWLALFFSLAVSLWLVTQHWDAEAWSHFTLDKRSITAMAFCGLLVLVRDLSYAVRLRWLTGNRLSFWKSIQVILLWEFGSAFSYGAVGGKALMLYVFRKENLGYGRAVFTIMASAFLDNLVFLILFGLLFATLGSSIFQITDCPELANNSLLSGLRSLADHTAPGFLLISLLVCFLAFLLFIQPQAVFSIGRLLSRLPLFRRWKDFWQELATDIHTASVGFRQQSIASLFFLVFISSVTWLSRFALANAVITVFQPAYLDHLRLLSRQFVLWFYLITPTTPGSSGTAEASFMALHCDFLPPGIGPLAALVWRAFSFYLYILIGAWILSFWLNHKQKKEG